MNYSFSKTAYLTWQASTHLHVLHFALNCWYHIIASELKSQLKFLY